MIRRVGFMRSTARAVYFWASLEPWIKKRFSALPGNEVVVYVKASLLKDSDECKPMPLDLPKNARIIGVADLKSDYRRMLSETNAEELRERIAYEEGELQKRIREESESVGQAGEVVRRGQDGQENAGGRPLATCLYTRRKSTVHIQCRQV